LIPSIQIQKLDKLSSLFMLGTSRQKPLINSHGTLAQREADMSIIELFDRQVLKSPHATALIFKKDQISYQQLNERANQVAHYLLERGIKEEVLVPICIERGIDMIIGMLGILKAGGAYVPIDPEYPAERINYMIGNTNAPLVLSSSRSKSAVNNAVAREIIEIDTDFQKIRRQPVSDPKALIKPHHLAYVIYTSGSTGRPKGVMIEHQNVFSFICWCRQEFSASPFEIVYATTSICFDLSVFEIFYTLTTGKPIRILDSGLDIDKYLGNDNFVLLNTVPVVIDNLLKQGTDLKNVSVINMAGEPVPYHVQQGLDTKRIEVRNLYGPTEDTTYSTFYRLQKDKPILIGKPILNTIVRIVPNDKELAPVGESGEICIGGAGLARGYLNLADLTKQKFIADPFTTQSRARLYKTGDLGRMLPDGNIEYLGRIDNQVKIRGYRIELGEIESVLQQSGFVQQAIVVAKEESGNKRLSTYYVPNWDVITKKERQLYLDRVNSWKEIYEVEYVKTEDENINEEFNLIGWNDSFTGAPIAEADMRLWLDDIVSVILSETAENVLEIGCGTGLIYYQLAGKVKKYIGTDFSTSSISQIKQRISKGLRSYGETELQVCAAHEVAISDDQPIDTIILNSIVQYFPGEEYMNNVVERSLKLLKGQGRIIIGDVRDKRLLHLFNGRLQLQTMSPFQSIQEFKWAVDSEVLRENELCIAPEYFYELQSLHPGISHVEIKWKNNSAVNEMALYRYTVVIYVGIDKPVVEPAWQAWKGADHVPEIVSQLQLGADLIAFKDVPNPRLFKERFVENALHSNAISVVGDVVKATEKEDLESAEIWKMLSFATAKGYTYSLLLNEDPLKVNLLLERDPSQHFIKPVYRVVNDFKKGHTYTNIPLFTEISSLIQKDLIAALDSKLPDFMVPAEFFALNQLPLTTNGKVDRKFLSERKDGETASSNSYKAPGNDVEKTLVKIWQDLMGIERIGIQDNFFHLGGHSLLAIRIISAMRARMNEEISLKDLVMYPTIAELSKQIHLLRTGSPAAHIDSKLLIPLKTKGDKVPLYIVSGGGGTVFAFKRFVDMLDDDQPVYGFQQPTELKDINEFPETIEGIAAKYIEEILVQNPEGPYALSGHCVGGIIAFEMARQMEAMGKQVKLLAMFDTILPKKEVAAPKTWENFYHIPGMLKRLASKVYLKLDFEMYLIRNHTRHAIEYKVNALKSLIKKVYPYKDDDLEMKVYKTLECNFETANDNYELKPCNRDILVFYAKDHFYFLDKEKEINYQRLHVDDETKNRWKQYAGSVTIHEVAGEHSTFFDPAHGNRFARLLQQHLNDNNSNTQ
jgi:amino acid adenylation domain-containing protein